MNGSVTEAATIKGRTLQTIGGGILAMSLLLSAYFFIEGDPVTGGILLLYLPVAALLLAIGRKADLV